MADARRISTESLGDFFRDKISEYETVHGTEVARRLVDATFIGLVASRAEQSAFSEDRRAAEHMAELRDMVAVYEAYKANIRSGGIADD